VISQGVFRFVEESSFFNCLNLAILIVDPDQRLVSFNQAAAEMLNLNESQIGSPMSVITPTLDLSQLAESLQKMSTTQKLVELEVKDANERWYSLRITPYASSARDPLYGVIILQEITPFKQSELRLKDELDYNTAIVNTLHEPLIVLDDHLQVVTANDSFYNTFQVNPADTEKQYIYHLGNGQWDIPELRRLLEDILPSRSEFIDYEVEHSFPSIGHKIMCLNAREFQREYDHARFILLAIEDITERKKAEQALKETHEREHHISDVLQRALITNLTLDKPTVEIAAIYQPALAEAEVGGDFYDVFALNENQLAVIIGDVSGKGLDADVFTAMSKYMLRAYAYEHRDPRQVMERFNEVMTEYMPEDMFVTIQYGILDTAAMTFTYANGGHEPLLVYNQGCACSTPQDLPGSVIGVLLDRQYDETTLQMSPGNALVLYTDGITDARVDNQFYGIDGLSNTLKTIGDRDAEAIAYGILEAAIRAANGTLRDDAAVLVLKAK
jgi:PAS domain S-box-containing protein